MNAIFARVLGRKPQARTKARTTKFRPEADGLEKREVMAASVVQSGSMLTIVADNAANNNVSLSVQSGKLDVNVNGKDTLYSLSSVSFIVFNAGATKAGSIQTFTNSTSVMTQAIGGSGRNVFTAGSNYDYFIGGMGVNNFTARSGFVVFEAIGTCTFAAGTGSGLFYGNSTTAMAGTMDNYYAINTN